MKRKELSGVSLPNPVATPVLSFVAHISTTAVAAYQRFLKATLVGSKLSGMATLIRHLFGEKTAGCDEKKTWVFDGAIGTYILHRVWGADHLLVDGQDDCNKIAFGPMWAFSELHLDRLKGTIWRSRQKKARKRPGGYRD